VKTKEKVLQELKELGITNPQQIHLNCSVPSLYELSVRNGEAIKRAKKKSQS